MRRVEPYQPQGHPMPLRRQRQPARGGKIECARIARHLPDHAGEIAAPHPFLQREQRILRAVGADVNDAVAQGFGQAGTVGPPGQPHRRAILHPQYRASILRLLACRRGLRGQIVQRQRQREARSARIRAVRENLAMARPGQRLPRLPPVRAGGGKRGDLDRGKRPGGRRN